MDQSSIISLCNVYNAYKVTVYISVEKVDPFFKREHQGKFLDAEEKSGAIPERGWARRGGEG